ncbi:TonB-dependent receptor [Chitinophaga agrisoli]|uniref:TonB-dependent receptor n=1 Tax=Chitinophaga agrisoli TaxID=2607653 RepID=A0A5B2VPZ3_9BACT|nr:outer membrane beta-barrel family protein [Chitinophaga agrisoli]KAA2240159.1 TonB-dependent receptor [Chitinophaga agrisoli]
MRLLSAKVMMMFLLFMGGICRQSAKAQDTLHKQELQAVTVNGVKPYIVMRTDKIILNVAESPIAAGGDALQVLSHAPGVIDQGNGNFELRGKRVAVLIDGQDSRLSGEALKDWLAAMPANSIDKIELISNPPARYDARGAAVINIISTRNRNFGANGTVNAGIGAGQYTRYNAGMGLNYRNERVNVYGNYDYSYNKQYYREQSVRQLNNNRNIAESSWETRERNNHSFKAGADYDINARSAAGIVLKGLLNYRYRKVDTRSVMDRHPQTVDSFSTVNTTGDLLLFNPSINAYYRLDLDTTGKQLTVNADYFHYDKSWNDDYITNFYEPHGSKLREPYLLQDNSPADNMISSVAADYTQPLWKGKLEAGVKATITTTDNDIQWRQQREKQWVIDSGKTNHFVYRENIYAAYANYSRTLGKFDLQAGLRAEHTHMEGESLTLNKINTRDQLDLFPSFVAMYNQSAKHHYGFSYRKSIERFSFNIVNPFVTYVSQYFYYQGNPNIRPSIGHAFELSYTYNDELFTTLSYQRYSRVLTDIYRQDTGNVVISTYVNLRSAYAVNASIIHTKSVIKDVWNMTSTVMATYAKYIERGPYRLTNASVGMYANVSNSIMIGKGLTAELSATYTSPMAYGVYKMKARYYIDAGIAKNILHNAGRVSLNVTDIFNTYTNKYDISSFGVISSFNDKEESRFVKLAFSYKFGNQRVKAAGNRKTGIEKERARMEGN